MSFRKDERCIYYIYTSLSKLRSDADIDQVMLAFEIVLSVFGLDSTRDIQCIYTRASPSICGFDIRCIYARASPSICGFEQLVATSMLDESRPP